MNNKVIPQLGGDEMNIKYIKEKRIEKGLSLEEVSKLLGYSTANGYWKIEKGITELTVSKFIKLIVALDLDVYKVINKGGRNDDLEF